MNAGILSKIQADLLCSPNCPFNRPTLLRALFTVGLLCKNFDFDSDEFGEKKVESPFAKLLASLYVHISHARLKLQFYFVLLYLIVISNLFSGIMLGVNTR